MESAVAGVSAIASRIICEPTRRSYTQVHVRRCQCILYLCTVFVITGIQPDM